MTAITKERISVAVWIALVVAVILYALLYRSTPALAARAGIYTFGLVCSEPVVERPILLFVDASGRARPLAVIGEVPGIYFKCRLILPDNMATGIGRFEFEEPLVDRAGNLGHIIENPELLIVMPKSLPHTYLSLDGKWVESQ